MESSEHDGKLAQSSGDYANFIVAELPSFQQKRAAGRQQKNVGNLPAISGQ